MPTLPPSPLRGRRRPSTLLTLSAIFLVSSSASFSGAAAAAAAAAAPLANTTATTTTTAVTPKDTPKDAPKDAPKDTGKSTPGKKFITPLSNDDPAPAVAVVGGIRIQADLPPIIQTPCDGCRTVAAASTGEPIIVDNTVTSSSSARLLPNDLLNTVAMRAGSNDISYSTSSSSSSSSSSPMRVISSVSSAPCLPACVSSGCSSTCLHIYSIHGGSGGVVSVASAGQAYQTPKYVSNIRSVSAIDNALESTRPSATDVSPVRVVSSSSSSSCVSTCMPSCLPGCIQLSFSSPVFVASSSSLPATRTVSVSKVASSDPIQVHTVVPSDMSVPTASSSFASPCDTSCMPACSQSCVHLVSTTPMRVVSSTSSSTCLPACMASSCSITCLRMYSPSFKQLSSKAEATSEVGQELPILVRAVADDVSQVAVASASPTLHVVRAATASHPTIVSAVSSTCVSTCMPKCSDSCIHVVHTSPVRVVTSTSSSTCMSACMPSCDGVCTRLHVASGVSGGTPAQQPGADIVAVTSNVLPSPCVSTCMPKCSDSCIHVVHTSPVRVVTSTSSSTCMSACMPSCDGVCTRLHVASGVSGGTPAQQPGADIVAVTSNVLSSPCVSTCMPKCSDSCIHVVHTSPVRVVTGQSSSTCLPACMPGGCTAICLRMYTVDTGVGSIGTTAVVSRDSNKGDVTHDGMRVASGFSGGIPTTGESSSGLVIGSTPTGCFSICQPSCSSTCVTRYATTSLSVPTVHSVPVATIGVVQPHFKQVGGRVVVNMESANAHQHAVQMRQLQQQQQQQAQESQQQKAQAQHSQMRSLSEAQTANAAAMKAEPNAIIIILVCGIVVVLVSVGVAVYLLACKNKKPGEYTEVVSRCSVLPCGFASKATFQPFCWRHCHHLRAYSVRLGK